ncbi:hypothetical protein PS943_04314 [Pseudomonas fluorescens]|uniref:Calcium/calmodulin-dependent protein kinase II association-domain domain-containing protein n=1 Tax=Pseudomonas fluorescens TaxID=294 RepID=A0A5E7WKL6_PSEFL|nr:hypothetical protein PS943_04314 [Pseudomonas fluorescens]
MLAYNLKRVVKINNVAMDSGVDTFTLTDAPGKNRQVPARYTFVYEWLKASGRF